MRATVGKWGNSLGLRIPRGLAQDAQLADGTTVDIRVEDGRLVVEAVVTAPAVSLEELVARITPENLPDLAFDDAPRGGEAW